VMPIYRFGDMVIDPQKYPWGYKPWKLLGLFPLLWLDASDSESLILDSEGNVEEWRDKSGGNRHATENTTSRRPTYISDYNGIVGIEFDGVDDRFILPDETRPGITDDALFYGLVFTPYDTSVTNWARNIIGCGRLASPGCTVFITTENRLRLEVAESGDRQSVRTVTDSLSNHTTHFAHVGRKINYEAFAYVNGVSSTSTITTEAQWGSYEQRIGDPEQVGSSSSGDFYDGLLHEVFILDYYPDENTLSKIEGYLAHKWGLTANLPSNHPYKDVAP